MKKVIKWIKSIDVELDFNIDKLILFIPTLAIGFDNSFSIGIAWLCFIAGISFTKKI